MDSKTCVWWAGHTLQPIRCLYLNEPVPYVHMTTPPDWGQYGGGVSRGGAILETPFQTG